MTKWSTYLPGEDCKISEFIPSSKTSTKKLSIITIQKLRYLLRFCNLYHNQMKLKDVCLEGCENSSKVYFSINTYLIIQLQSVFQMYKCANSLSMWSTYPFFIVLFSKIDVRRKKLRKYELIISCVHQIVDQSGSPS